jgi:hypothetical protein
MPGEGDVTALLFRRELRILLSSIFGEKNRSVLLFSWTELRLCFSRIDGTLRHLVTLFLAGGHMLRSVFCRRLRSGRCKAQILINGGLSSTCSTTAAGDTTIGSARAFGGDVVRVYAGGR